MKQKIIAVWLLYIFFLSNQFAYGVLENDQGILSAEIENVYYGRQESGTRLKNNQFSDVAATFWGTEAISQMAALGVVQGYRNNNRIQFQPNKKVTNEEALAMIIRSVGLEEEAKQAAEAIGQEEDSLKTVWSKGYLTVANQIGLIDNNALADGLVADQKSLDANTSFIRTNNVTRQQMATWLAKAIHSQDDTVLAPVYNQQEILAFNDWQRIDLENVPYVEAIVQADIMQGSGKKFNPNGSLTRGEMAQTIRNMGPMLYKTMNIVMKTGYVGHISREYTLGSGNNQEGKTAWIRGEEGQVDQLIMVLNQDPFGKQRAQEVIVHKGGRSVGFDSLEEGDSIVYLVDDEKKEVAYIYVQGKSKPTYITGALESINENGKGQIRVKVGTQKATYNLSGSLFRNDYEYIRLGDDFIPVSKAPITEKVVLTVFNQLVVRIERAEELKDHTEISGIVSEHNREFNYLRITDWNGNEVVKRYRENEVNVERQAYYDEEDDIGYIDELFPSYVFDEDDAHVDAIEVGDIIHIRVNPQETEYIVMARAKTNYIVKFGEVMRIEQRGDLGDRLMIQTGDGIVSTFNIENKIPVMKSGYNVGMEGLQIGDQVRMLVNQAVTGIGSVVEHIKEIGIDPYGNNVENVYKGQLGTINSSQQTVTVLNGFALEKTGWRGYTSALVLDVSNKDVEYYYNDQRISLSYAERYLKQGNMDMYVVTENYFSKEKVKKVAFREGRDHVLETDSVVASNGYDYMKLENHKGRIQIDDGTIVIKNGKHVAATGVTTSDYVQVVLNGEDNGAVVVVKPEPNQGGPGIMRGRIAKINTYEDFTLQSHVKLKESEWIYSRVERTYTIDYKTEIREDGRRIPFSEFKDYSEVNKVDEVYTILADGTYATHIVKMPYTKESILGEIYEIQEERLGLKNISVYDERRERWSALSRNNNYGYVQFGTDALIIKNGEVIEKNELEVGDKLRIMSDENMKDIYLDEDQRTITGYIFTVEN